MQSRSGKTAFIGDDLRNEIASARHTQCSISDIKAYSETNRIISVGDVTTETIKDSGITPFLEVVDLKTKRGERSYSPVEGPIKVKNPPGTLTSDLFMSIRRSIESGIPTRIEVEGEADLAVIPIIYYADKNTVVAYGIPDVGMACITVTPEVKEYVNGMVRRMKFK